LVVPCSPLVTLLDELMVLPQLATFPVLEFCKASFCVVLPFSVRRRAGACNRRGDKDRGV
jgi:hypothetical protein